MRDSCELQQSALRAPYELSQTLPCPLPHKRLNIHAHEARLAKPPRAGPNPALAESVLGRMNATVFINSCLALVFCGCGGISGHPEKARTQILRRVPLGTRIDDATNKLTRGGFRCTPPLRGAVFYDMASTPRFTHTNATVMSCTRNRTRYFGERMWVIGLPYDESRTVTNVFVQVWDRGWLEF